ncbi:MAG: hypothetical protein WCG35_11025 [Betaproteobacteria bacterium]
MKAVITSLLLIFLSGCATTNANLQSDNSPIYKIIAVTTTELDKHGNTCADATGTIRLYENGVYGSAIDSFGRGFKITGKIDASGKITGGFALSVITAVDFIGQHDADKKYANGTWKDIYECKGTWNATKTF